MLRPRNDVYLGAVASSTIFFLLFGMWCLGFGIFLTPCRAAEFPMKIAEVRNGLFGRGQE